jgi:hypothetical protein
MPWTTLDGVLVLSPDGDGFVLISREELERREAAMTPGQRRIRDMIAGNFAWEAAKFRALARD